jgi:hypothetical protein
MGKIKVNLIAVISDVICAPGNDRWYLRFQTASTDEPYTVALPLQSGLELLGLLEQARKQHQLPSLVPTDEPIVAPAAKDRN